MDKKLDKDNISQEEFESLLIEAIRQMEENGEVPGKDDTPSANPTTESKDSRPEGNGG